MKTLELVFDVRVFSLDTIKRALYRFADKCSFDVQQKDSDIIVTIHSKVDIDLSDRIIRTLILANAFSNTGLIE